MALLVAQPNLRSRQALFRTALGAAALAALAAGSAVSVGVLDADPTAVALTLGSVISLVGSAAAVPQPLSLLRDPTRDVSGLSPARWRLGAASCASWVSYGWLIDQPTVWLSAGFGLCCALVMCAILSSRRSAKPAAFTSRPAAFPLGRLAGPLVCPAHARAVLLGAVA